MVQINVIPRIAGPRVGLILPSPNTTTEPEMLALLPTDTALNAARVYMKTSTAEGLRDMNAELKKAVREIATVMPDVVAYACTRATFMDGADGLERSPSSSKPTSNAPS